MRRIDWYKKIQFVADPVSSQKEYKDSKRWPLFCDRGWASITSETITSPRYPIIIDLLRPTSAWVVSRNGGHTFRSFGRLQVRRLAVLTISCSSRTPLGGRRYHWRPSKFSASIRTRERGAEPEQKKKRKRPNFATLFYINKTLFLSPPSHGGRK
jgi:hypothetical protein